MEHRTTVFHTPKLESHNVLNVEKNTIPRGEENRSESRDAFPQTCETSVLKK